MSTIQASKLYELVLAQAAAESYLHGVVLNDERLDPQIANLVSTRLRYGNNHFEHDPLSTRGATRLSTRQVQEFFTLYEIIDQLPNQISGFSATLLRDKRDGSYTLAFRSTEYNDIEQGGDAQRDSVKGADGDIAFNGMAFGQISSMEKYWKSLLDGTRLLGATPDDPAARGTTNLRIDELRKFSQEMAAKDGRINVSGYSLGGHLASMFAVLHPDKVEELYLFNAAGLGQIRVPGKTYRDLLAEYEYYMRPENAAEAYAKARQWVQELESMGQQHRLLMLRGQRLFSRQRLGVVPELALAFPLGVWPPSLHVERLIELAQSQQTRQDSIPLGPDKRPMLSASARHFLVSLFVSAQLDSSWALTSARILAGEVPPSLQELGLLDSINQVYQVHGRTTHGAPPDASWQQMLTASDWNLTADSGLRAVPDAQLISVYIEDQPTATGWPFGDSAWGDFGNTHSLVLIADSLAVTRLFQRLMPDITQASVEGIMRAASNLRKEHYRFLPSQALAEHDTLERTIDALGRVLFGRAVADEIDWSQNLTSANGASAFSALAHRDPFHDRVRAIEQGARERGLLGALQITSLVDASPADLIARAMEDSARGLATRYALKELNPFTVEGDGLYERFAGSGALARFDPSTGGGLLTDQWIADRVAFLTRKIGLNTADYSYQPSNQNALWASYETGDRVFVFQDNPTSLEPQQPIQPYQRNRMETLLHQQATLGHAVKVLFGRDGDGASDPGTRAGGRDTLAGGLLADRLYGEGGDDILFGRHGNDYLEGGAGDDQLTGGPGDDVLAGGPGLDRYIWNPGDGNDRIVDARDSDGRMNGQIVIRQGAHEFSPTWFRPVEGTPGSWQAIGSGGVVTLTQSTTWMLSFPGGTLDLGSDLRAGDFGIRLEVARSTEPPTISGGIVIDNDIIGPNLGSNVLVGGYGHNRLFAQAAMSLEVFLPVADAPEMPGWGMWFNAGPGDDLVLGTASDDIIYGGGGSDILAGGPGADLILADRDQTAINRDPTTWVYRPVAGEPFDTEFFHPDFDSAGTPILSDFYVDHLLPGNDTVYGGAGADRIYADTGDDVIFGDEGDDLILGGEGDDALFGGEGDDRITGELHGYAGRPFDIVGSVVVTYPHYVESYGNDVIDGGPGDDELIGEGGDDVLFGGPGDDRLYGDIAGLPGALHGADLLDGGAGDDALFGQGGGDILLGGAGNDILIGDSEVEPESHGDDWLDGEDDDDLLIGAGGADTLLGGDGKDILVGDAIDLAPEFHGNDWLDGGDGDDVLFGLGGDDELYGSDGDDRLHGDDPDAPFEGGDDWLEGGAGDDVLRGQGGDDVLRGGLGTDLLYGEAGNDILEGGPGSDRLEGGFGDDEYVFSPGDGADHLFDPAGTITLSFGAGIALDDLQLRVAPAQSLASAPLLLQYGDGDRVTIEGPSDPARLRLRLADGTQLGAAELQAYSAAGAARLAGNDGSEALVAEGDVVRLFGLSGDDLLIGSERPDHLYGGEGDDLLEGWEGDDVLIGGDGDDLLAGGAGNDRLEGGLGDDRYLFGLAGGIDTLIEMPGGGFDTVELDAGLDAQSVRLRRAGDDLVLALRADAARLYASGWFGAGRAADPGLDAILYENGALDRAAIVQRVESDRTLLGTAAGERIEGDEFDDIVVGGRGDDVLAGLLGDDRYRYAHGDGSDVIEDSGGYDVLEFGLGISPWSFELELVTSAAGERMVILTMAQDASRISFGEAREQRIEAFEFATGELYGYSALLALRGGIRQSGSGASDALLGGYFADALHGFDGDDQLFGEAGHDLLVGGQGNDFLAGGPNDDRYVFNLGDGRDTIFEYAGLDEYLLFRTYLTADGRRAIKLDGVEFTGASTDGFASGEVFWITLGTVNGGTDRVEFGPGIEPQDIRFGLQYLDEQLSYPLFPSDGSPQFAYASQVSYWLEIGDGGDAIELRWPNAGGHDHQRQQNPYFPAELAIDQVPVERLAFASGEQLSPGHLFRQAGGWHFLIGSAADETFETDGLLAGVRVAGGRGDDVYRYFEGIGASVLELPGEGEDTLVFGPWVESARLWVSYDQQALVLESDWGTIRLPGFVPTDARRPGVEWFEFADGSIWAAGDFLQTRRIRVPGSPSDDVLHGTSLADAMLGDAGDDRLIAGAGDDWLAGGRGRDVLEGGEGSDTYWFSRGDGSDLIQEHFGGSDEADTLMFGPDIAPDDVSVRREGHDLLFELPASGDQVTVQGWFQSEAQRLEMIVFAQGDVWLGDELTQLFAGAPQAEQPPPPAPVEPPATEDEADSPASTPDPPPVVAAPDPPADTPPVAVTPEPPATVDVAAPPVPDPATSPPTVVAAPDPPETVDVTSPPVTASAPDMPPPVGAPEPPLPGDASGASPAASSPEPSAPVVAGESAPVTGSASFAGDGATPVGGVPASADGGAPSGASPPTAPVAAHDVAVLGEGASSLPAAPVLDATFAVAPGGQVKSPDIEPMGLFGLSEVSRSALLTGQHLDAASMPTTGDTGHDRRMQAAPGANAGTADFRGAPGPSLPMTSSPLVTPSFSAGMEALAAGGFVSPGRPLAPIDQSGDAADAPASEVVSPDDTPQTSTTSGAELVAYWQWMHAQLDAHLAQALPEEDQAPPPRRLSSVLSGAGEGDSALSASSFGLRERTALELRAFEGLRDGISILG